MRTQSYCKWTIYHIYHHLVTGPEGPIITQVTFFFLTPSTRSINDTGIGRDGLTGSLIISDTGRSVLEIHLCRSSRNGISVIFRSCEGFSILHLYGVYLEGIFSYKEKESMKIRKDKTKLFLDGRQLSDFDLFVSCSIDFLSGWSPYGIVSGYETILFDQTRSTEEMDIPIPFCCFSWFLQLHDECILKR